MSTKEVTNCLDILTHRHLGLENIHLCKVERGLVKVQELRNFVRLLNKKGVLSDVSWDGSVPWRVIRWEEIDICS